MQGKELEWPWTVVGSTYRALVARVQHDGLASGSSDTQTAFSPLETRQGSVVSSFELEGDGEALDATGQVLVDWAPIFVTESCTTFTRGAQDER